MRRWLALGLAALLMTGCARAGAVPVGYKAIAPEKLPPELAHWRDAPSNQIDIQDAVVGKFTYVKIAIGPCPSGRLKVDDVSSVTPDSIWVELTNEGGPAGEHYPVVYLRLDWEARLRYAARGMQLQINGMIPQHANADIRPDVRPGVRPGAPDAFRPKAFYQTNSFACTGLRKAGSR